MFLIRHKNILIVSIFKIFAAPRRAETRNSHPGGGRSAAAGGGIDEGFYLGCRAGGWAGLGWGLVITQYSAGILYNIGTIWVGARSEYIINVLCVY